MKRVLILEDNAIHRKTLLKLLKEIDDIQVYEAENKEQAYAISMDNIINLFLVDIILDTKNNGDVSGLKFVERIRKIPQYSFTPLIFITSLEDPKLHAYRNLHCYGYIEKPFDKSEVLNLIRKALKFPEHQQQDEPQQLYLRIDGVVYCIQQDDIIYVEHTMRQLVINTTKEKISIPYKTLNSFMDDVSEDKFIKCSRSTVINKGYVQNVDIVNKYIKLRGIDELIEIGPSMKKRIVDEFSN